jgi:hypothetical protein
MHRLVTRALRRLAQVTAVLLVSAGIVIAVDSPAHAAPPGCSFGAGHYEEAGNYIYAYRYWFCEDGNDIPLSVSIQRYQSPGVYQTVASGSGEAVYYCGGTLYNVYRTTGTSDFAILCS